MTNTELKYYLLEVCGWPQTEIESMDNMELQNMFTEALNTRPLELSL